MAWAGRVLTAAALALCASPTGAFAQQLPDIVEVRSLLREAGSLVSRIEESQKGCTAANIAGQQAAAGDLDGALATIQPLANEGDRSLALSSIATTLAGRGEWRTALRISKERLEGAWRAGAYVAIALQLADGRDYENALAIAQLVRELPEPSNRIAHILARISVSQWKAGDGAGASRTLSQALDAVEHSEPAPGAPGLDIGMQYVGLINDLAFGNPGAASVVLERFSALVAEERDPDLKGRLLGLLSSSQTLVGDVEEARRAAEQLPPGAQRDMAFLIIVEQQARSGDIAGARRLAAEMPASSWSDDSLQQFAYALADADDLSDALEAIDGIRSPAARTMALAQVALQKAEKSAPTAAWFLSQAMEATQTPGEAAEAFNLELIAVTRAMLGDLPGSLQMINGLSAEARQWPLWSVTPYMVEAGRKTDALALAHAQESPLPRAYALLGIASELMGESEAAKKKARAAK